MFNTFKRNWGTTIGLLALGSISILFGVLQITFLTLGDAANEHGIVEPHYRVMPVPILVHILTGSLFNLTSPFQFAPIVRRRWPKFHRAMGRILLVCGFLIGASGIWMNVVYPDYGGTAKYAGILTMSIIMILATPIAVLYARIGKISEHTLWMKIAVAITLSPATQRLFLIPILLIFGEDIMSHALIGGSIWAGMIINLGVVFWTEQTNSGTTTKLLHNYKE